MTDLHTHILPRMDDGAPDTAASLAMLRMEAAQGVTGVALTPHFHRDRESIEQFLARRQAAWEHLSAAMEKTAEPFPDLVLGAEVAWMPNMNHWDDLEALCLGSSRYLLLELPFTPWSGSMIDQLYSLAAQSGVTPVLASGAVSGAAEERAHTGIVSPERPHPAQRRMPAASHGAVEAPSAAEGGAILFPCIRLSRHTAAHTRSGPCRCRCQKASDGGCAGSAPSPQRRDLHRSARRTGEGICEEMRISSCAGSQICRSSSPWGRLPKRFRE